MKQKKKKKHYKKYKLHITSLKYLECKKKKNILNNTPDTKYYNVSKHLAGFTHNNQLESLHKQAKAQGRAKFRIIFFLIFFL